MPTNLVSLETIGSVISLAGLETVLGIDNVIFLAILVAKMPAHQQTAGRRLGLVLALGTRILLLLALTKLAGLTTPFFSLLRHPFSGRDLVLIVGGGFLIFKSTWEIFSGLEAEDVREDDAPATRRSASSRAFALALVQIALMDVIFSLDSVITAVGIAPNPLTMITAMIVSMLIMLGFARVIGDFVNRHPSMKVLALSFLILIGTLLVAEGGGQKINKGYVYAAMTFGVIVEFMNLWLRKRASKVARLNDLTHHASILPAGPGELPGDLPLSAPLTLEQRVEAQALRIAELEAELARLVGGTAPSAARGPG